MGGEGDEALQGGDDTELQTAQRPPNDGNFIASDEDEDFDDDGVQLAHAPGPASPKQKVPVNTQSPVPNPKIRNDGPVLGDGHFGTDRKTRTGKKRRHEGVDLEALPGTTVRSPVDGTVEAVGDPYGKRKNKPSHRLQGQFNSIWIRDKNGTRIKLFYVAPTDANGKSLIEPGDRVKVGQQIGTMQDRASATPGMTNHVHVEVLPNPSSKIRVDPAPWLKAWGVK